MAERRASGDLEAEILGALWGAARPLTTSEILQQLHGGLAYNTVQTILARLLAKGAVERERTGRAHAYSPLLTSEGIAALRIRAVLDDSKDSEDVLTALATTLTPSEGDTLKHLLNRPGIDPDAADAPPGVTPR